MDINDYIAPDGLMCLKPNQLRPGYDGLLETPLNDNGILYKTICNMLEGYFYFFEYLTIASQIQHEDIPGLFHRSRGRDGSHSDFEKNAAVNSHDNIEAMLCSDIMMRTACFAYNMDKHGYIMNNVTPGKINWMSIWTKTPSGLMTPATMFLLDLALQRDSSWLRVFWYCARITAVAFVHKHYTHHSAHIRAWMTNTAVLKNLSYLSTAKAKFVGKCIADFDIQMKKKSGGIGVYFNDFPEGHPCREMGVKL